MKLIIEAGSSNTQSVLISDQGDILNRNVSSGINPTTDPEFENAIRELNKHYGHLRIEEIYFYGSGCIDPKINRKVEHILLAQVREAGTIKVTDDLTGSGVSCFGRGQGLIVIVGTGSIIGYYDGTQLIDKLSSGGYLLGDEGSGFSIGQKVMTRYIRHQYSTKELNVLQYEIKLSPNQFIDKLYEQNNKRKYLASFAPLINKIQSDTRNTILNEAFGEMCKKMISPMYKKYEVAPHFIGSIAFYFQDILTKNLKKFNILAGSFHQSAIDGLVEHHRHE